MSVAGATVSAQAQATVLPAGPGIEVRSVSQSGDLTVFIAQAVGTLRRRAQMPMPTSPCAFGRTTCPRMGGGYACVDITEDITSELHPSAIYEYRAESADCGGCSLWEDVRQRGVDCTTLFDGDVKCIAGQCVA